MGTVVILGGARAIGKTWTAELLEAARGVSYVDGDSSILGWMEAGMKPGSRGRLDGADPRRGHATPRITRVRLGRSDWRVGERIQTHAPFARCRPPTNTRLAHRAPEDEMIQRLKQRTRHRLAATEEEARGVYRRGAARAAREHWDLTLDVSGEPRPDNVLAKIGALL